MATYERVHDGQVVERVTAVDGSHEDTRLGVAALDGVGGWRVAAEDPPARTAAPAQEQEGGEDGLRDTGGSRRAAGARSRPGER